MTALTTRALNRTTLARQLLLERSTVTPVAAIEQLAGMQAQLARPPHIGLWSRIEGYEREQLTRAVVKRDVVRATMMRGTLHLVSKKDFLALRPVLQAMLDKGAKSVLKERADGLDLDELCAEAKEALDERPRTMEELRDWLVARHPGADERAMGYLVRMTLPLVQVPDAEAAWSYPGSADFAAAETWLGKPVAKTPKPEALVLRYLGAFGPATAADLQTWSGVTGGKELLEPLREKLVTFRDAKKRELFDVPDAPHPDEDVDAPVRFLPDFDNLLLAHADRTRIVADEYRPRLTPSKNLRVLPTFLVDGFVAGTWDAKLKKSAATLVLQPFATLAKKARAEVVEEAERLLRFLEPEAKTVAVDVQKP